MDTPMRRITRAAPAAVAGLALASSSFAQVESFDLGPGTALAADGTQDGGYVVAGTKTGPDGQSLGVVFKMQPSGQVDWAVTVDDSVVWGSQWVAFTGVAATATGCVVVGHSESEPISNRTLVASFDHDGSLLWHRSFHATGRVDIVAASDGTLVAPFTMPVGESEAVAWITPDGATMGAISWGSIGLEGSLPAVVPVGSGILVAGNYYLRRTGLDLRLVRMETDGTSTLLDYWQNLSHTDHRLVADDLGNILLVATQLDFDSRLFTLDAAGTFVAEIALAPAGPVEASAAWPGGGWIVATPSADPGTSRLVRLDPSGSVVRADDVSFHGSVRVRGAATGRDGVLLLGDGPRIVVAHVAAAGPTPTACLDVAAASASASLASPLSRGTGPAFGAPGSPGFPLGQSTVTVEPLALTAQCASCMPLDCGRIVPGWMPRQSCANAESRYWLTTIGGEGFLDVSWDVDGDGIPDASGNPLVILPGATDVRFTAWVTDECAAGAETCSLTGSFDRRPLPPEVSDVIAGSPPLLVVDSTHLLVELLPGAVSYHAHVGTIGAWGSSARRDCNATQASTSAPPGMVELRLDAALGASSWVVVTASQGCGEGSAGTSSLGRRRDGQPSWVFCTSP